jgi:UDP-sugar transporter A1/2/3
MKRRQSKLQIVSLVLLLLSALVIEKVVPIIRESSTGINEETQDSDSDRRTHVVTGVFPVLAASFLSGLAGAISEKTVYSLDRNAFLFTMELSVASCTFLISSLLLNSPDSKRIQEHGFFSGWTSTTWIPICTKAMSGVVVGLVTKHAGVVRKGFALIFGLLLSGIVQNMSKEEVVTKEQIVGGILGAVSLWIHSSFPYVPKN